MSQKIEEIEVEEHFTDPQLKEISECLAKETIAMEKLDEEKKKIVASYTAKINSKKTIIKELADNIDNGFRMKKVKALVYYHVPEEGKKSFVDIDVPTIVYLIEEMSEYEKENPEIW